MWWEWLNYTVILFSKMRQDSNFKVAIHYLTVQIVRFGYIASAIYVHTYVQFVA
jgi:hypothetical protein